MKVLTIHDSGLSQPDFCWGVEGEIAIPPAICDSPSCGCDRSHSGLNSHKASTTVMVREVDLNFDDLVTASAGFMESAGWAALAGDAEEAREDARDLVAHSAEVATNYPVGVLLRPEFDRGREEWRYTEVIIKGQEGRVSDGGANFAASQSGIDHQLLSEQFEDQGVAFSPERIREVIDGAPMTDQEEHDWEFGLIAIEDKDAGWERIATRRRRVRLAVAAAVSIAMVSATVGLLWLILGG